MPILRQLLLLVTIVMLLGSCKQYKYSRVQPKPVAGAEKLLPLYPVIPYTELNAQYMYSNDYINEIAKIYKDGVKNISEPGDGNYNGYFTFRVKDITLTQGGTGMTLLSFFTFTYLFGVPIINGQTNLEGDFEIYDAKKNLVAKYSVKIKPEDTKAWMGFYFSYSFKNMYKVSTIKAYKLAFEEFSRKIAKDADAINAKLNAGGTNKVEEPESLGNIKETTVVLDPNREFNKLKGGGTGYLISSNGYIVTSHHVIEDATKIEVIFSSESATKTYIATVVKEDKTNDIAVLKIDSVFVSPGKIPYIFSDDYNVSDEVYTIGYPQPDVMGSAYKYTKGEISSLSGFENNLTMMQITTPLQPGNSGGPLFNKKGDVVGMATSTLRPTIIDENQGSIPQNVNYAVKSDYIKPIIKQYMDKLENSQANLSTADQIKLLSTFTCLIKVY